MRSLRRLLSAAAVLLPLSACSAPISTLPSPAHQRTIQIQNTTDEELRLFVLPVADPRLRAPTTFTGTLRPGERKVLYLYHGFYYRLVSQAMRGGDPFETRIAVERDLRLDVRGASFVASAEPEVEVGEARPVRFTDARDRVRAMRGEPDRRVERRVESGFEGRYVGQAYEVWTYFGTGYRYVFLDETRSGRYALLTSTDPEEQGRPDWRERLPENVVDDLMRE